MGKIVISGPQNVSLDGVVQDPDGEEGFRLGGWFVESGGKDLEEWNKVALAEALGAEAWLLDRHLRASSVARVHSHATLPASALMLGPGGRVCALNPCRYMA